MRYIEGGHVEQTTGANPVEAIMGKALQPKGTAKTKALSQNLSIQELQFIWNRGMRGIIGDEVIKPSGVRSCRPW